MKLPGALYPLLLSFLSAALLVNSVGADSPPPLTTPGGIPLTLATNSRLPPTPAAPVSPPSVPPLHVSSGDTALPIQGSSVIRSAPESPLTLKPKVLYKTPLGPWGQLDYYVTYLQIADHCIDLIDIPSERTVWHFPENSSEEIFSLLEPIRVPSGEGASWRSILKVVPNADGGNDLIPPDSLILALSPESRSRLASLLRRFASNLFFDEPVIIDSGDPITWYREARLEEPTIQLIASLCYQRGASLVFSDIPLVFSRINSLEERRRFLRSTTRTQTLVLRLNVGESENLGQLADYWTAGYKTKDILPILESVEDTPGVERLDIAHLLPPTPRKLLYSFPSIIDFSAGDLLDCYWTSLNFFRYRPQAEMGIRQLRVDTISNEFEPATGEPQFGDMIVLFDAVTKEGLHSAIYIAADIVFTKNGRSPASPWILMRYEDMAPRYTSDNGIVTQKFRLK